MGEAAESASVCARYRTPVVARWTQTILAVVWFVVGLSRDPYYLFLGAVFALLALAAWLLPATVITEHEAQWPLLRRAYPWSKVEGCDVGTGWKAGLVQLQMRDGNVVGLAAVPREAVPGIRRLIEAADGSSDVGGLK